jgi:fluoride exporter
VPGGQIFRLAYLQMRLVLVAVGGAIGSTLRYALDGAVYRWLPPTFPFGTFVVNVTGCALFGLLLGLGEQRLVVGSPARTFLLIGVLGGFTTFSSFAFETVQLLRGGEWLLGVGNVVGQVVLGLAALWIGFALGRALQGT